MQTRPRKRVMAQPGPKKAVGSPGQGTRNIPRKVFLDLGSRTGEELLWRQPNFERGRIIASDIDLSALRKLRENTKKTGKRVEAVALRAQDLPFKENSVDVITGHGMIGLGFGTKSKKWPSQVQRVMEGVGRALKPGGVFVLSHDPEDTDAFKKIRDSAERAGLVIHRTSTHELSELRPWSARQRQASLKELKGYQAAALQNGQLGLAEKIAGEIQKIESEKLGVLVLRKK